MVTEMRVEYTTYPEPAGGATREEAVKAYLKAAYRNPGSTPMNSRETTATGRALSERFTNQLDVLSWVREPYLTARQANIIRAIFLYDWTLEETAQFLCLHRSTVSEDKHAALQTLIRIFWDEPDYVLPRRSYRSSVA